MNSIAARYDFDNVVRVFNKAFRPQNPNFDATKDFVLTQSYLRLEQPLVTTSTQYVFPVLVNIQNQAAPFNTEQRLQQQDTFGPNELGIFLGKAPAAATDTNWMLRTYTNPFIFTNATQMQSIYNGSKMQIQLNQKIVVPQWDVLRHWKVPITQQTAAAGAGSPLDQFEGGADGFYPLSPFYLLSGTSNIQIIITLVNPPSAVDALSRLIVYYRGYLAQNSTILQ